MAEDYKIKAVSATVKEWDSKFGPMKTYKLMLEGRELPVEINKKQDSKAPAVGDQLYGTITRNEYGDKIKTEQKNPGFGGASSSGASARVDNSDGQRQGMCFNNATAYINALIGAKTDKMSPDDWAVEVHAYAAALYSMGDLKDASTDVVVAPTEDSVEDAWGNLDIDELPKEF